jgi:ATP-dependent 26S proteasome regulatory subunit
MGALQAATRLQRALYALAVVGYVVLALVLWSQKDFVDNGPLSHNRFAANAAAFSDAGVTRAQVLTACYTGDRDRGDRTKIVAAKVQGRMLFACYAETSSGTVNSGHVVDTNGSEIREPRLLKPSGAWPYYALVKTPSDFFVGGIGVAFLMPFAFIVTTRRRGEPAPSGTPWWGSGPVLFLLAVSFFGLPVLPFLRRVPPARKARFALWGVAVWAALVGPITFGNALSKSDVWAASVAAYITVAVAAGAFGGIRVRPALGLPPIGAVAQTTVGEPYTVETSSGQTRTAPQAASGGQPVRSDLVRILRPETLPNFRSVGGMDGLKKEIAETLGLVLAFSDTADAYRINWNGILLHGDPGVGKSFVVAAVAGEFGLNLIQVSTGDLVSSFRGESARNVDAVFAIAAQNLPAILFFDEFDSIAMRRDDNPDQEARRTVNALLQALERTRGMRELVVMAATNDVGSLDPAVIRPGRFDRHVLVDVPDAAARKAIFAAQLAGRPGASDVDLDELARRSEGLTPAAISQTVTSAALAAMRESAASTDAALVPLTTDRLITALATRGGRDRPTIENWSWDKLVLPDKTLRELQQITALLTDPDRAASFGIDVPSGVLLYGPPGTGKTTIARVLAAESNCSFYAQSAGDLTSKWVGESERLITALFQRARANRPSIIFIDEIDAIASARGDYDTYDRQVNQLLQEIDGMKSGAGVLVVGATNRRDKLDPALLRGGRLSRHIHIPLPVEADRRTMLELFSAGMPLDGVDLRALATRTDGLSGADLDALCDAAGVQALIRAPSTPSVTQADFDAALADARASKNKITIEKAKPGQEGYI